MTCSCTTGTRHASPYLRQQPVERFSTHLHRAYRWARTQATKNRTSLEVPLHHKAPARFRKISERVLGNYGRCLDRGPYTDTANFSSVCSRLPLPFRFIFLTAFFLSQISGPTLGHRQDTKMSEYNRRRGDQG